MQQGDPIEERYKEYTERGTIVDQLSYCITSYREAAMSPDPKFDHIDINEKQKVIANQYFSFFYNIVVIYYEVICIYFNVFIGFK